MGYRSVAVQAKLIAGGITGTIGFVAMTALVLTSMVGGNSSNGTSSTSGSSRSPASDPPPGSSIFPSIPLPSFSSSPSNLVEMESFIGGIFDIESTTRAGTIRGGNGILLRMKGASKKLDEITKQPGGFLRTNNVMSLWVIEYPDSRIAAANIDDFAASNGLEWSHGRFLFSASNSDYIETLKSKL